MLSVGRMRRTQKRSYKKRRKTVRGGTGAIFRNDITGKRIAPQLKKQPNLPPSNPNPISINSTIQPGSQSIEPGENGITRRNSVVPGENGITRRNSIVPGENGITRRNSVVPGENTSLLNTKSLLETNKELYELLENLYSTLTTIRLSTNSSSKNSITVIENALKDKKITEETRKTLNLIQSISYKVNELRNELNSVAYSSYNSKNIPRFILDEKHLNSIISIISTMNMILKSLHGNNTSNKSIFQSMRNKIFTSNKSLIEDYILQIATAKAIIIKLLQRYLDIKNSFKIRTNRAKYIEVAQPFNSKIKQIVDEYYSQMKS